MDGLLTKIFGADYLAYQCDKITKTVRVDAVSFPDYVYHHKQWEDALRFPRSAEINLPASSNAQEINSPVSLTSNNGPEVNSPDSIPSSDGKELNSSGSIHYNEAAKQSHMCKSTGNSFAHSNDKNGKSTSSLIPETLHPPSPPQRKDTSPPPVKRTLSSMPFPDLKVFVKGSNYTRLELASLQLPPVIFVPEIDLDLVPNPTRLSNPFLLAVRPSDTILKKCLDMLHQATVIVTSSKIIIDDEGGEDDYGVQVGGLGVFNKHALNIWSKALEASSLKNRVNEEIEWINSSQGILSSDECEEIKRVLANSKPCDQLLSIGNIICDVHDFSTLVGERYLTGFVIDVACLKIKEECNNVQNMYIPSLIQEWSSANDVDYLRSKIVEVTNDFDLQNLQWVLTPLNVGGAHWGLLCLNLKSHEIFYDDGLHWNPPSNVQEIISSILQVLHIMAGHQGQFNRRAWDLSLPLRRLGMPKQPPGSGSCGMGVIMGVQSIFSCKGLMIPSFNWKFDEMWKHRRLLMAKFLDWK